MAKDPTQGPVSTYDAEGTPTKTNVEETPIEEAVEETPADESAVEEEDAVEEESEEEISGEEDSTDGEGEGEAADDEEAPDEEADEDAPDEAADETPEDEPFEAHEHEVSAPLSYAEAEKQLKETAYAKLKEMAVADELKPERSKAKIIVQLLNHWFAEPPSLASSDSTQPMSARVRRIKEASSQ